MKKSTHLNGHSFSTAHEVSPPSGMVDEEARQRPDDDPGAAQGAPAAVDPTRLGTPTADQDERQPGDSNGPTGVVCEQDDSVHEELSDPRGTRWIPASPIAVAAVRTITSNKVNRRRSGVGITGLYNRCSNNPRRQS
jgi:hypothetical protein